MCEQPTLFVQYEEIRPILDYMYKGEINVAQKQLPELLKVKGLVEEDEKKLLDSNEQQAAIVCAAHAVVVARPDPDPDCLQRSSSTRNSSRGRGRSRSNNSNSRAAPILSTFLLAATGWAALAQRVRFF